jgi:hypothetical protein
MVRLAVVLALVAGCAGSFGVPTERMPISWEGTGRHMHWVKGGVPLQGMTCGKDYQDAVTGVPAAEERMADCEQSMKIYGIAMGGFVLFPLAGIAAGELIDHEIGGKWFAAGLGLGGAAFIIGFAAAYAALTQQDDAMRIYDAHL